MHNNTPNLQYLKIGDKVVGVLRGSLLDIRRHRDGFWRDDEGEIFAISIAKETLRLARKANMIMVRHIETGETYCISRAGFDRHSQPFTNPKPPFDQQRLCYVRYWAFTPAEGLNVPQPINEYTTRAAVMGGEVVEI